MKRISVIGAVTILAVFCLFRVELVAKEPVEKTTAVDEAKVIKPANPDSPHVKTKSIPTAHHDVVEYSPPSEAKMAKLPPYVIAPPDVVRIDAFGQDTSHVITGCYLVGPDGTVNLREYGSVNILGKTVAQTKEALEKHLAKKIESPKIHVEVEARNSKAFYIIEKGDGDEDKVVRLPCTGNETVRDAMKEVPKILSAKSVRISRPILSGHGSVDLFVNVQAIRDGSAEHNYQILPGDRLFVEPLSGNKEANSPGNPKVRRYSREKSYKHAPYRLKAQPLQYTIHLSLVQKNATKRNTVLSSPTLIVLEGRESMMHVGGEVQQLVPPGNIEAPKKVAYGNSFCGTVSRRKGKTFLDGTFRHTVVQKNDSDGMCLAGSDLRIIRPVELGKKFAVLLPAPDMKGSRSSLEIMVERSEETPGDLPIMRPVELGK